MPLAGLPVPTCSVSLLVPLDDFYNVCQGLVWLEVPLLSRFSTLRAGSRAVRFPPALGDTGLAEIVPAVDGDWIFKVFEADGALCLSVELLEETLGCHG